MGAVKPSRRAPWRSPVGRRMRRSPWTPSSARCDRRRRDMSVKYKVTAEGGLALQIAVNLAER